MLKIIKINLYFLFIPLTLIYIGCSSGEYDIEKYEISYTEKTVKIDTLKKITIDDKGIKEDKKDNIKDSYSYSIQIGAFGMQDNFEKFYEQARMSLGEDVYSEQSNNLYKVRVGNFPSRADAMKRIDFIKSKGYNDAFVITKMK
jgi:cell division protein FtsN